MSSVQPSWHTFSEEERARRRKRRRRRRLKRRLLRAGLIVAVVLVAVLAFTGYQAYRAHQALGEVGASLTAAVDAVKAGDMGAARSDMYDAQQASVAARRDTSGPVWWTAAHLPVLGADVAAVRSVADIADSLSNQVLPQLMAGSGAVSPQALYPKHGRIDVALMQRAAPHLATAHGELQALVARADAIDTGSLVGGLRSPVTTLQGKLREVTRLTGIGATAARLLPPLLGADGPRTYLVMFQNNAEIRATGGIAGVLGVLKADDGQLSLRHVVDSPKALSRPAVALTPAERAIFGSNLATFPQDVNFTPDFPRVAQIASAMWRQQTGIRVDGVIATDPVALSYIMTGTGPITVKGGQLTASNVLEQLLHQVYMTISDPLAQNAYYKQTAQQIFADLTRGHVQAQPVLQGMLKAIGQGRVRIWSSDPAEERTLLGTAVGGQLPTQATRHPVVGVYFNDATGAKMDYYLHSQVSVTPMACGAERELRVDVRLRSAAPADAAHLPEGVIGPGYGAPPGSMLTDVLVYAPFGAKVLGTTYDGKPYPFPRFSQYGRPVVAQTIPLSPGQQHLVSYRLGIPSAQDAQPQLSTTPGMPWDTATVSKPASCTGRN